MKMSVLMIVLVVAMVPAQVVDAAQVTLVHSFQGFFGPNDGSYPEAGVINVGGRLYGTASNGGLGGRVFSMNPDGSDFQVLHHFASSEGARPSTSLTATGSTIFGTTSTGGANFFSGTLFSMELDGTNFRVLHTFGNPGDGSGPRAGLTPVGSKLYGSTESGGANGAGILFSLNTDGTGYQAIHTFTGFPNSDGGRAVGNLVLADSKLYGTTFAGGPNAGGTIFTINPDGSDFQLLRAFSANPDDGQLPLAGLTLVGSTLYGTTSAGGANAGGTIFSINTDGSDFRILHSFAHVSASDPTNGTLPAGELTLVGSTLYGTTSLGGVLHRAGTVYSIGLDGGNFQVLHSFTGGPNDGDQPLGGLTLVGSNLYGTTRQGGAFDLGTVFAIAVPEPSSLVLIGIGGLGVIARLWRGRRSRRVPASST